VSGPNAAIEVLGIPPPLLRHRTALAGAWVSSANEHAEEAVMSVVVGYGIEAPDEHALQQGIDAARERGVMLHIAQCVGRQPGDTRAEVQDWLETQAQLEAAGRRLVAASVSQGVDATYELVTAPPEPRAIQLLEFAKQCDAELIVIGYRQRSRVGKGLLGSAAQDVLLSADCPVLAVPEGRRKRKPAEDRDGGHQ
jgi:nucleotide-binding universal stress UspA family protein